jgi:hypothetical protein
MIGEVLNLSASPFHDHNLQAIVSVKMNVSGRHHVPVRMMLYLVELV